jgi:cytochrome-b5 reductase
MKDDLEALEKAKNFKFNLRYIIDKAEDGWTGGVGFINKEMVDTYLPKASDRTIILICGPPIMRKIVKPMLMELGHMEENIVEF